jgi:carbonic anhydrase/acetyltransferase-like protein (isoleucine patch superfamily)
MISVLSGRSPGPWLSGLDIMPMFAFEGKSPDIHPTAWIAPTATIVGDVTVEAEASVWFGVVLRADFGPIVIEHGANIQDNSVVHGGPTVTVIGAGATVGHSCVVHGARVGPEALIGNSATVLDGAIVGRGSLIAAGATVAPGTVVPDDVVAVGTPARVRGPVEGGAKEWVQTNPATYRELADRYSLTCRPIAEIRPAGGRSGALAASDE